MTVVAYHHLIALFERFAVVEGGLALLGVVGYHHVKVLQRYTFLGGSLHNADAPVHIGRVAVAQVVGRGNGEKSVRA